MIRTEVIQLGRRKPLLSVCVQVTPDVQDQVDAFVRFLKEADYPSLEVVVAYFEDEPWNECVGRNALARAATTDYLAFTCADDHPTASLMAHTRRELEERPNSVVLAMKLTGLPDYRAAMNPFALGDWICVRREQYFAVGGYNEELKQPAGWTENEFLGRAVLAGCDLVMLDERIFHAWHPTRPDRDEWDTLSKENVDIALRDGGCLAILYYPTTGQLLFADNKSVALSTMPQIDSVVNTSNHLPYNDDYWICIHHDKSLRLFQGAAR